MDVFTTFSNLAAAPIPDDRTYDGMDLSPVLFGEGECPRDEVYYYRGRDLFAMRKGAFKAHFITQEAYGGPQQEKHDPPLLYNVEEDPSERFNIAESHPEIVAQIKEAVEKHRANMVPGPDLLAERGPEHIVNDY